MKLLIFFFTVLFSNTLFSQKNIIVIDSVSREPISFANIKILNTKNGYYSNDRGIFNIIKLNQNDTLLVSCLGYFSFKENINKINDTILLSPKVEKLKEVILSTKKPFFKKIGFKKKNMTFFTGIDLQLALFIKPIKVDRENYINSIIIPVKKNVKHINREKEEKKFNSILKISLFSMKSNLPYQLLTNTPIIIKYNDKSKNFINIDLSNEYVEFNENGIFICLEIIGEINKDGSIAYDNLNPRPGFVYTDKKTKSLDYYKTYYKTKFNDKWTELDKKTFHLEKDIFPAIQLVLTKYEK